MTADGNGSRTLRVPSHIDYSAEGRGSAPGSRPTRRNFRNSCASALESPLDQCAAMDILRCL
jgi:hypothetical protein